MKAERLHGRKDTRIDRAARPPEVEGWSPQGAVEELTSEESWARLRESTRGRLGVSADELPGIYPVDYAVSDGTIIFRTAEGEKLRRLRGNPHVVFEADGESGRHAWSVVVTGLAHEVDLEEALREAVIDQLPAWAPVNQYVFVQIDPSGIRGRYWAAPHAIERD